MNPKFILAVAYFNKGLPTQEASSILVPIDAVCSMEKQRGATKWRINFKKDYDYGLSFKPDTIEAEVFPSGMGGKIDIIQ